LLKSLREWLLVDFILKFLLNLKMTVDSIIARQLHIKGKLED
jgi:hypothetical protein